MRSKLSALVWLLVIAGVGLWLAGRLGDRPFLDADLLALLPATEHGRALEEAGETLRSRAERRLVILVSAEDDGRARDAADYVFERLEASRQFDRLDLRHDGDTMRQVGAFYYPHRFSLLTPQARQVLSAGDMAAFERRLLARYFNPVEGLSSQSIAADPLFLLTDYLGGLGSFGSSRLQLKDGYLGAEAAGEVHLLLLGELAETPFSLVLQDRLAPLLRVLRAELPQRFDGARMTMAGVLPHAVAGTESARYEISRVGLGSLLGIFLLFVLVFRSARPFFMSFLSIAAGCLGGFALCLAVFGQVHLLTLVFGASLVGISVDYSLHYFCEAFREGEGASPVSALRRVFPGITLGLVTSVIGFAGLLVAPFPGMREMAVFSSAGLIFAYLTVVAIYPLVQTAQRPPSAALIAVTGAYQKLWERKLGGKVWLIVAVLIGLAAVGCLQLKPLDDFRLLQARDAQVLAEEDQVKALAGQSYASQYFLLTGDDENELLERGEDLTGALQRLVDNGELGAFLSLSNFVPSPSRQAEDRALIEQLVGDDSPVFRRLEQTVGLPDDVRAAYGAAFKETADQRPLALSDWLESAVSDPFRHLWLGATAEGVVGAVVLQGVADRAALQRLADGRDGVVFFDRVHDLSQLFSSYRNRTLWLTAASYVFVTLLLLLRYGLRGALGVVTVPLGAAVICFGALGFLAEPISLFNIMALLLILGIGVDYGIFFREAGRVSKPTLLAVAMSSTTTVLAFGLLAVSATAAVHSFGITLLIGISAAFFLSPLAALTFPDRNPPPSSGVPR